MPKKPITITATQLPKPVGVQMDSALLRSVGGVTLLPGEKEETRTIDVAGVISGKPLIKSASTKSIKKKKKKSSNSGLLFAAAIGGGALAVSRMKK